MERTERTERTGYKYDAFISYRHLSPDKPVAEKLQTLLETYAGVPKGKKLHLFRDETELPTASDLGGDIRRALEQSRFLIVICSEKFEASRWCMEEVRYFKQLHGGSNGNILTLFVGDGTQPPAFPEPLRFENRVVTLEDGAVRTVSEEIEPLAANVSAPTLPKMLKKLKTEFLRIAAPLLGCGFDDLYKRDQRRRTRRKLTFAFTAAGILAAAALLALAALLKISAQSREIEANAKQIEEDAMELRRSNLEILLGEAAALEKAGDLFGAIEAAAASIPEPEDGTAPLNGSLAKTAQLTGAFEPEIFTACRKLTLQSRAEAVSLLENGTRLLVKTMDNTYLFDADTGEPISELPKPNEVRCFHTRRLESASFRQTNWRSDELPDTEVLIDSIRSVWFGPESFYALMRSYGYGGCVSVGGSRMWLMFERELVNETTVGEDMLFVIRQENGEVCRLDPSDGSALWSAAFPEGVSFIFTDENCPEPPEGLPVVSGGCVVVLDPRTGEELGRLETAYIDEVAGDIPDVSFVRAVCTENRLVLIINGSRFLIFENIGGEYRFVCSGSTGPDVVAADTEVFIRGNTLFAAGCRTEVLLGANPVFFAGFDAVSGELKWMHSAKTAAFGGVFAGFIEKEKAGLLETDTAFAVVFDRLFAVNAATGELISTCTLAGQATEAYYSENGFVFLLDEAGREIATPLTAKLETAMGVEGEPDLWLIRDIGTDVRLASYRGNAYAVVGVNDNEVCVYRSAVNGFARTVYGEAANSIAANEGLTDTACTLAAFRFHDNSTIEPDRITVVDIAEGSELYSLEAEAGVSLHLIRFAGDGLLAVSVNGAPRVFDRSGSAVLELSSELFADPENSFDFAGSSDKLLFESTEGKVMCVRPGGQPELVCDPARRLNDPSADVTDIVCSPSGARAAVCTSAGIVLLNLETGGQTVCDMPIPPGGIPFVWNEDETGFCILKDDMLRSFSAETGEPAARAEYGSLTSDILNACGILCVVEQTGDLVKIELTAEGAVRKAAVSLGMIFYDVGGFSYRSLGNGRGILRCGSAAWLMDEEAFEIVYRIDGCIGADAAGGFVYAYRPGSGLLRYPIYTAGQLREHAASIIGR